MRGLLLLLFVMGLLATAVWLWGGPSDEGPGDGSVPAELHG